MRSTAIADIRKNQPVVSDVKIDYGKNLSNEEMIKRLEKDMRTAAVNLEFEKAAALRDEIKRLQES
jgi:excinuclease ABC subunit B